MYLQFDRGFYFTLITVYFSFVRTMAFIFYDTNYTVVTRQKMQKMGISGNGGGTA
jgi:hypothetical protein